MPYNLDIDARVAVVGDRSPSVRAHARIPGLLERAGYQAGVSVEVIWIPSEAAETLTLGGFDGIYVVPGSPYRSEAGALRAVRIARQGGVPFLGTCGGFQHALLEIARDVCGLATVAHAENEPAAPERLIVPLECALYGGEAEIEVLDGTLAARLLGAGTRTVRYHCGFGLDRRYRAALEEAGVVFSAFDGEGGMRVAELPSHPFFLGTLFQPELTSDETLVNPVIAGFVDAVAARAGGRTAAAVL